MSLARDHDDRSGGERLSGPTPSSDWDGRTFAYGVLGWVIPGLIALPLAWQHESSGGESVLLAVLVWLGLGVVGCLVAGGLVGARVRADRSVADAFGIGFAGVAISGVAAVVVSVAIEKLVGVLHLGPMAFLFPIPLVLGYGVGFGIGFALSRS